MIQYIRSEEVWEERQGENDNEKKMECVIIMRYITLDDVLELL